MILYEALTGRRPHEGTTAYAIMHSIGEGKYAPPRSIRPDIPIALEAVIVRAMNLRPQDRFESVHGLGRALLPLASAKRRVIWSDYYERDRPPVSPGAPPSYPDPPRPPVAEEGGTMALDGLRGSRADATRTRSAAVLRPPAATRVALPKPPPAPTAMAPRKDTPPEALDAPRVSRASQKVTPYRTAGLRKAVVIAGLIALGAGGYAAWVDPDIAGRIPDDMKATIKRHLPNDPIGMANARAEKVEEPGPTVMPSEKRIVLEDKPAQVKGGLLEAATTSAEGRVVLADKPARVSGGLLPESPEDEALRKLAEAAPRPTRGRRASRQSHGGGFARAHLPGAPRDPSQHRGPVAPDGQGSCRALAGRRRPRRRRAALSDRRRDPAFPALPQRQEEARSGLDSGDGAAPPFRPAAPSREPAPGPVINPAGAPILE